MPAPRPVDDAARVDALLSCRVLDTPPEAAFDDLARLASAICGTPIALVSLVDADRQWFKSRVGLDATETPRDLAFCGYAVLGGDLLVVPDAAADERFRDNPLVTGDPHIRFYAGMPLTTPEGFSVGTLCAIDRVPRSLTPEQTDALRVLGRQAAAQLVLRRQVYRLDAAVRELRQVQADLRDSEARFRAFMDNSPAGAFIKDEHGRMLYFNETLRRRFDVRDAADWLGKTDAELWPAEVAGALRANDLAVLAGDGTAKLLESVPAPDGSARHWQVYKFPFRDGDGRRLLAGMAVDVTAEKAAEEAVRASEAKFRRVVDRLAEGVFVVDPSTRRAVEANAAVLAMLGYTAAEFLARDPFELGAGEPPDAVARQVAAALAADGRCDLGRRHFRRKDGTAVPVDVRVTLVPDGRAGLHAVIVRDVTEQVESEGRLLAYQSELEAANARLRRLAVTDGLTGTNNRRAFNDRLAEEHARAVRCGGPLSVALLDVDHFKAFNDAFGHPAGDEVLKAVAGTLQQTVRATDFVARYGGEEFALVLSDTDFAGAMVLAERCRRAVADRPWGLRAVTVSVGVSTLTAAADADALVAEADAALYRSKQAGRNRVNHGSGTVPAAAGRA